jgi:hypothetical protein
MECRDVQKLLSEYIDGVLSDSLAPVVKQHITTCDQCRDTYHSMNRLIGVMREMEPVDEPADFRAGVRARLEKRPSLARRLRPLFSPPQVKIPLGVAAALVVVVMVFVLPRPDQPTPEPLRERVVADQFGMSTRSDKREKKAELGDDETPVGPDEAGGIAAEKKGPEQPAILPGAPRSGDVAMEPGRQKEAGRPDSGAVGEPQLADGSSRGGEVTGETPAEEETAVARTESLDEELLDIDALMEVTTMEKKSVPAPPEGDSAVAGGVTVDEVREPVDERVAAAGGKLIDTVTNEDGKTVALIARVPADSLQAVYRLFGRENVTFATADMLESPDTSSQEADAAKRPESARSRGFRYLSSTSSPQADSVLVRIRVRP